MKTNIPAYKVEFHYNIAQLCGHSGQEGKIHFTERRWENLDGSYASSWMENGHDLNLLEKKSFLRSNTTSLCHTIIRKRADCSFQFQCLLGNLPTKYKPGLVLLTL